MQDGSTNLFTTDSHLRDYDIILVDGNTVLGIDGMKFDD